MSKPVTAKPLSPVFFLVKESRAVSLKDVTQKSFRYLPFGTIVSILPRVSKKLKDWAEEENFWMPLAKKEFSNNFHVIIQTPLPIRGSFKSLLTTSLQIYIFMRKNFLHDFIKNDRKYQLLYTTQSDQLETSITPLQRWVKDYVANRAANEVKPLPKFDEKKPIMSLWEISGKGLRSAKLLNNYLELTPRMRLMKPELIELGKKYHNANTRLPALMKQAKKLAPQLNDSLTTHNLKNLKELLALPAAIICLQVFQREIRHKVYEVEDTVRDEIENFSETADLF